MGFLLKIRNNWKKSVFAACAAGYGLHELKSYIEITQHMRAICSEVANIADTNGKPCKRVVVIMNPVANKKKAENKFKKYCEPILHLAGYSVEIVKTNYVGHAKVVIENLKVLPDAIVIAGGDGTSSEVVTGLMRREEAPCPIVLLPLGAKNETALKYANLEPKSDLEYVKSLSNTILPMIHENVRYENVIKYDVIESNTTENEAPKPLKPIYGLNSFSWGLLRDIESVKDKYWYFGFMRHYAAALFNSFSSSLNWKFGTNFVYTPPCPGCRNCAVEAKQRQKVVVSRSLFGKFIPTQKNGELGASQPLSVTNDNCNTQIEGQTETNQLTIACNRNTDAFYELETKFINSLAPGFDFIKNIPNITQNHIEPSLVLKSRTIQLIPTVSEQEPEANSSTFYSIDGEEYDARPIKVSIVPKAIKVFC